LARERRRSERGKRAKSALCPHCGKEFRYLAQHIKLAHLGGVKFAPATCHICKKVYTQKSHLKQHVRAVHEQVLPGRVVSCVPDLEPDLGKMAQIFAEALEERIAIFGQIFVFNFIFSNFWPTETVGLDPYLINRDSQLWFLRKFCQKIFCLIAG
jgi:hypothetical protein